MLRKFRESLEKRDEGFTLIELLVVVIIIGILAAIAIPVFLNQREKAYKRTAESDARNAAIAMESYFSDVNDYPVTQNFDGTAGGTQVDLGNGDLVSISNSVLLKYYAGATDYVVGAFCIEAYHDEVDVNDNQTVLEDPADIVATYKSDAGGIQTTPGDC